MTKLDARIKKRWINALRSGKYKQAEGALNNGKGGFCCLGVLCDLFAKENKTSWDLDPDPDGLRLKGAAHTSLLPPHVAFWASGEKLEDFRVKIELENEDGRMAEASRSLAELNDEEKLTLSQIADIIEEQL